MIGFLSSMDAHVAFEGLKMAEVRSTDLTRVWLLSCMNQHVGTKMRHLEDKQQKSDICLKVEG